jgi:hypothetical protein
MKEAETAGWDPANLEVQYSMWFKNGRKRL